MYYKHLKGIIEKKYNKFAWFNNIESNVLKNIFFILISKVNNVHEYKLF